VAVTDIVPVPGDSFEQTLASAGPDVLREMIRGFAQRMMDAEVENLCGAGYGEVSVGSSPTRPTTPVFRTSVLLSVTILVTRRSARCHRRLRRRRCRGGREGSLRAAFGVLATPWHS
jgi:hypothetical protein